MELIILHGPPGVGKQTIGEIVATTLGYPLLSSHRMMAEVGAVFGWGTTPFLDIRDAMVSAVQSAIPDAGLAGLVWVTVFEPTVQLDSWHTLLASVDRALLVDLQVDRSELERRLQTDTRRTTGKATSIDDISPLLDHGTFALPDLSAPVLVMNTSELTAQESARAIVAHLRR